MQLQNCTQLLIVHSPISRGVEEGTCGSIRLEEGMIGVLTAREKELGYK